MPFSRRSIVPAVATVLALAIGSNATAQTKAWEVRGIHHEDALGASLAIVGDLDGDGFEDIAVGAPGLRFQSDMPGRVELYPGALVLGGSAPFREWVGDAVNDSFGASVAALGDVDGDGVPDLAIGAPDRVIAGHPASAVFVYSGKSGALLRAIPSASAIGPVGAALATIGDLDGDGVRELIYSDTLASGPVVTIVSGATGRRIRSHFGAAGSSFGESHGMVDRAGDVDGDGVEDYIVGAPTAPPGPLTSGLVDVYSGRTGALLRTLSDGSPSSGFGTTVSGAGDLNGDGHADLLASDPNLPMGAGSVLAIDGATGGVLVTVTLSLAVRVAVSETGDVDLDGTPDLVIDSAVFSGADGSGLATLYPPSLDLADEVDGTVDIDHDGILDIVASGRQPSLSPYNAGWAVGQTGVTYSNPKFNTWHFGASGNAYDSKLGASTTFVADRDGDGLRDVAVGEPRRLGNASGAVSIRSSRDGRILAMIDPHHATNHGGVPYGDEFGVSIVAIDDVNGDGVEDLAVGARSRYVDGLVLGAVEIRSGADDSLLQTLLPSTGGYWFGWSIASGTDANGHVFLAVGAPYSWPEGIVEVFDLTAGVKTLSRPSGSGGPSPFGFDVGCVGDVDGDGVLDWFAGDYQNSFTTFLVFSGRDGRSLWYQSKWNVYGAASIGDLDGDGISDVVLGDVVRTTGAEGISAYSGTSGTRIFRLVSPDPSPTGFGRSIGPLGDVNGDGLPDFAVGAPSRASNGVPDSGSIYVFSGRKGDLLDRIDGDVDGGRLGEQIAQVRFGSTTDVDGDGIGDLLAGSPDADTLHPDFGRAALVTLDDLFLEIDPPVAAAGTTVAIDTRGGPSASVAGLELVAVDGAPVNSFIAFGTFSTTEDWSLSGTVPAGLSGHVASFRSFAIGYGGKVVDSTEMTLTAP